MTFASHHPAVAEPTKWRDIELGSRIWGAQRELVERRAAWWRFEQAGERGRGDQLRARTEHGEQHLIARKPMQQHQVYPWYARKRRDARRVGDRHLPHQGREDRKSV